MTPRPTAITSNILQMIFAASRDSHPKEFACVLRAEGDTITEILLVPGTLSGDRSAILRMHMLPIDFSVVGTAHSHPTPNATPSGADLALFSKYGPIHIITGHPHTMETWRAFDRDGNVVKLKVI